MFPKENDKKEKGGFSAFLKCCMKATPKQATPSKRITAPKNIQKNANLEEVQKESSSDDDKKQKHGSLKRGVNANAAPKFQTVE